DLGHEGDEGDLADVGGFSGHVGAGDEHDLFGGGVEKGVVGDEGETAGEAEMLFADGLFDDGVAAFGNYEAGGFVDFGAAVIPLAGEGGPAAKDVEFGDGFGGFAEEIAF